MRARLSGYVGAEGRNSRRRPEGGRPNRALRVVALMGLCSGLSVAPAFADPHGSHALHDGSPGAWIGLALATLIGVGLAGRARRRRPAAIVLLALLVGLFGLESAVHSVHHFSDPDAAASCVNFSASQNVSGACAESPDVAPPTRTTEPGPFAGAERTRPLPFFSSHESRAPPSLLSA